MKQKRFTVEHSECDGIETVWTWIKGEQNTPKEDADIIKLAVFMHTHHTDKSPPCKKGARGDYMIVNR